MSEIIKYFSPGGAGGIENHHSLQKMKMGPTFVSGVFCVNDPALVVAVSQHLEPRLRFMPSQALPAKAPCRRQVFGRDASALRVKGTQVCAHQNVHEVGLERFRDEAARARRRRDGTNIEELGAAAKQGRKGQEGRHMAIFALRESHEVNHRNGKVEEGVSALWAVVRDLFIIAKVVAYITVDITVDIASLSTILIGTLFTVFTLYLSLLSSLSRLHTEEQR
jgi:hypothetical protein